jgi:hypothetical protein
MSDMAMPPDLSSLQAQLAALQAESDVNTQGKVKGFLQTGLQDPTAKYNYTEQLGGDVVDYMLESGIDLKKVSMEVAMAKLDEMMAAQEQIVQQLNEYSRQHKREINDAIRQAEDAQDELSAMRQVIQKVDNKDQSMETPATDSVDDLGASAPAPGGDMSGAPMDASAMPPAPSMDAGAGGDMPVGMDDMGAAGSMPAPDMSAGGGMPVGMEDTGSGMPPTPPLPVQPPQFAQGGYVGNPKYNRLKSLIQKKRGVAPVVSDQNLKVTKPSRSILQGVLGGV